MDSLSIAIDPGPGGDVEDLAAAADSLRRDLLDLDVEDVVRPDVTPPPGAKAGDAFAVGDLLVTLVASGGLLTSVTGVVQNWLLKRRSGGVVLDMNGERLELHGGLDAEDQKRILADWLDRQAARG